MIHKATMQGKWNFLNKTNVLLNVFQIIIFSDYELWRYIEVLQGIILCLKLIFTVSNIKKEFVFFSEIISWNLNYFPNFNVFLCKQEFGRFLPIIGGRLLPATRRKDVPPTVYCAQQTKKCLTEQKIARNEENNINDVYKNCAHLSTNAHPPVHAFISNSFCSIFCLYVFMNVQYLRTYVCIYVHIEFHFIFKLSYKTNQASEETSQ